MATIAVAKQNVTPRAATYLWEALVADSEDGAPVDLAEFGAAELTVQYIGTFSSATVTMQGSNNGTTWFTLNTPRLASVDQTSGAAANVTAALSAAGAFNILERPRYIRPFMSGEDGSDDVDVLLHIAKAA